MGDTPENTVADELQNWTLYSIQSKNFIGDQKPYLIIFSLSTPSCSIRFIFIFIHVQLHYILHYLNTKVGIS